MNKEKEMYMIIESLYDRIESVTGRDVCSEERKEYHISMMRLETARLLELLGDDPPENESILTTARENFDKVQQLVAEHGLNKVLQILQRGKNK
jgi:hypothetical protein